MTQEQLLEIQQKLREWCKERHLTVDMQQKGLLGNILEELAEGARANTDEELVDAICDSLVFFLNAQENNIIVSYDLSNFTSQYKETMSFTEFALRIIDSIYNNTPIRFITFCSKQIVDLGYDPYLCMMETIKEISSRKGEWNEELKKFKKYPGAYSVEDLEILHPNATIEETENSFELTIGEKTGSLIKWYKADYSKCKLSK